MQNFMRPILERLRDLTPTGKNRPLPTDFTYLPKNPVMGLSDPYLSTLNASDYLFQRTRLILYLFQRLFS